MSNGNEVNWPDAVWNEINDAVVKEVGKVRVAQKVFPTKLLDSDLTEVSNEEINLANLSIREGSTKSFVEIYQEFSLTATQVAKEAEKKCALTLARMAAKAIALAEDVVLARGNIGDLPGGVQADQRESAEEGLLGAAAKDPDDGKIDKISVPIDVPLATGAKPGVIYGEETFKAVAAGIIKLAAKAQAPNYALMLPIAAYADAYTPPGNQSLITTAERIKSLLEGGFYGTPALPETEGLLVALGGDPINLYVGKEAKAEYIRKDGRTFVFRVVQRIQFVVRDPRSMVLLRFAPRAPGTTSAIGTAAIGRREMQPVKQPEAAKP